MIIKDFKAIEHYRKSMSELSNENFGFDFELLYKTGNWPDHFGCYAYVVDEKVVSNVSYHLLNMTFNTKTYSVMQIGTVMTTLEYQGKGYSKALMDAVIKDHVVDAVYLFANESVLDYYPKFGFIKVDHVKYRDSKMACYKEGKKGRLLDIDNELHLLEHYINKRLNSSNNLHLSNDDYLKMFYSLYVFRDNIYVHDDAIIVCEKDDETLYVHDVYAVNSIDYYKLIGPYTQGVTSIEFGFELPLKSIESYIDEASHLYVKTNVKDLLNPWPYPTTDIT